MPKKRSKDESRRTSKDSRKKPNGSLRVVSTKRRVDIILKNLILFGVLFVLSVILYNFFNVDEILSNFFWILALITGFITVAFVITYFVFFFLRLFKK